MNTETQTTFFGLVPLTGAQKSSTVTTDSGIAAICIKGMRLPRRLLQRSLRLAISGSVTASKMRLAAVISPRMVRTPNTIKPGLMNWIAPSSIFSLLGR